MGKIGAALNMVMLLQNNGKMKIEEIARELEVSNRQVQEYKSELEQAGIFINSQSGKYGGYSIAPGSRYLSIPVRDMDLSILDRVSDFLTKSNNMYSDEYKNSINRIKSNFKKREYIDEQVKYFYIYPGSSVNKEKEIKLCEQISDAYSMKKKIGIGYKSIKSGESERVLHPYGIYNYEGDTYLIAYCENRKEVRDFKLCRISKLNIIDEKYKIDKDFDIHEYTKNSIGNFKGEEIEIHLIIREPFATIVSEKRWSSKQSIKELSDGSIEFRARMMGYEQMKSWILGMGPNVTVLEPKKLVDDIKEDIKKMMNTYNY
ncbi:MULTISPECIES: helix-turn-helix transcriptional regulator [Peptostreptococcales]|uniref:helix-turn-helix transcriptional regulator n=1 Tax=Peptostreptococcales TaxID=3082720 RepID=UPI000E4B4BFA|nr:WYL domain-containing transcriptional regulator [Peptoclostridium sp. AF21-18]RHQ99659.1 WYL domain-containing transcriptional regulator [Peptoclostridium sp. AF21-18]